MPLPEGFEPEHPGTWPRVEGSLEYVDGRLWYMPPSADLQQDTCADVVGILHIWQKAHRDFVVGTSEAGILLKGETRGADAAVWRRADVSEYRGELRRTPPVLAVEVAGKYDSEATLRDKATWYLTRGTLVVWLLFPEQREVLVMTEKEVVKLGPGDRLPPQPSLPDLIPALDELFAQISSA
jgi:Uma2 family endonuclease